MFAGHSPRRGVPSGPGSAGYTTPSYLPYQNPPQGYDLHSSYSSMYGVGSGDQQWPHTHPYIPSHLYNRSYDEWGLPSAPSSGFQPPSPSGGGGCGPNSENEENSPSPGFNPQISGDFKPPIYTRIQPDEPQSDQDGVRIGGLPGPTHHSPDSGLAVSEVSGPGTPPPQTSGGLHSQPPMSPPRHLDMQSQGISSVENLSGGGGVLDPLPARPQPARSPYEWMKRPGSASRPSKEGSPDGRTRTKDKYRVVYSDHQRLELEKEFHYSRYITIRRKSELAQTLNLSERQVKIWFQNRRAKERKQVKKRDELIQKEKLDPIAVHSSQMAAMAQFGMGPMGHMLHPHHHSLPHL